MKKTDPVLIIAEAGVNHNGDPELAKRLVIEAKRAGADCVKFQTFSAQRVALANAPKAEYQLKTTPRAESQLDMLKKLELSRDSYPALINLCRKESIQFLSTPYDALDADFLESLGAGAFKLASIHVVEHPFLRHVARKGKTIYLSTGMATLEEVGQAVQVIRAESKAPLILLQCTTNYPSSLEDTHLRALKTLSETFQIPVGYSDHTPGNTAVIAAVALGACVVEKHFTLDKNMPGPDQSTSLNPDDFSKWARLVRDAEKCLGSAEKTPTVAERANMTGMRRSAVAAQDISAGTVLTAEHILFKRPAKGLLGNQLHLVLGRKTRKNIQADELITPDVVQ
ncbi:MAG: N-acetylneuraminate synthase [Candidatus Omnitrophica bacterium]|nr:N-acetylneuraminate synthase [Candidatus Omnitrophota bacterium]